MRMRSMPAWSLREGDVFLRDGVPLLAMEDPQEANVTPAQTPLTLLTDEGYIGYEDALTPVHKLLPARRPAASLTASPSNP